MLSIVAVVTGELFLDDTHTDSISFLLTTGGMYTGASASVGTYLYALFCL